MNLLLSNIKISLKFVDSTIHGWQQIKCSYMRFAVNCENTHIKKSIRVSSFIGRKIDITAGWFWENCSSICFSYKKTQTSEEKEQNNFCVTLSVIVWMGDERYFCCFLVLIQCLAFAHIFVSSFFVESTIQNV